MRTPRGRSETSRHSRRQFLHRCAAASAVLACPGFLRAIAGTSANQLQVGQGVAEITPPLGVELAGFHRVPGQERRVAGIREPAFARALVLERDSQRAALVALDICAIGPAASQRIRARISQQCQIPAERIKLCASHTHSMPSLIRFRQWGNVSEDYVSLVEEKTAQAVSAAVQDLAPTQVRLGRSTVIGGNFNRTSPVWKTEDAFDDAASDQVRWLDRHLHALVFERANKPNLIWYHFSAHPVCFADELAGPDWPALVAHRAEEKWGVSPGYLQGHIGDVNPGDGQPWRGDAEKTANAVWKGLESAVESAEPLSIDRITVSETVCELPLDPFRWMAWLADYRQNPAACATGVWVDGPFSREWFEANKDRQSVPQVHPTPIACWQLGELTLFFHGSELYSYYGLLLRHKSPSQHTLVVGYADDFVGYLTDPRAHLLGEYAATVVPKILDLPPFQPSAASHLVGQLLKIHSEVQTA